MLNAVVVIGNPRFVKTDLANSYYNELIEFIESLGVNVIIDQALPGNTDNLKIGDIYIAHGREVDRLEYLPGTGTPSGCPTVKLGHPDGTIHVRDRQWQEAGSKGIPPNEHYIFTADQKLAIQEKIEWLLKAVTPAVEAQPRQAAARRPGVR